MFAFVRDWGPGAADDGIWNRFVAWIGAHQALLVWLGAVSLALAVATVLLLPVVVVRLPADYFVASRRDLAGRRGPLLWVEHVVRNLVGVVLVLAGIAMLLLPGQGLLTILIGALLVDFPGKRRLERWLVGKPRVLAFLNRMRARHGRPPLRIE